MSERIVDALEPVQVKEQQRNLLLLPRSKSHHLLETVQQQCAIRQAGQLIVMRVPARLRDRLRKPNQLLLEARPLLEERVDLLQCRSQVLPASCQSKAQVQRAGSRSVQGWRCRVLGVDCMRHTSAHPLASPEQRGSLDPAAAVADRKAR